MTASAWYAPRGLFGPARIRVVMYCFFDDSGKEGDATNKHAVIAGFMTNEWEQFDREWLRLQLAYNIPYLHMKEILGIAKKRGWDHDMLAKILADFASVIKGSYLIGFGIGVDLNAWEQTPKSLKDRFGDAQIFLCSRIVRRIIDRLENVGMLREEVTIIFDQDFEFGRLRLFEELKKLYPQVRDRLVHISFANARNYRPLQAADMLAWETRRDLLRSGGHEPRRQWKELMAALPSGQIEFGAGELWTKEWFDQEMPKLVGPFIGRSLP